MKLTDRAVMNLKSQSKRYEIWDGEGFGVRVSPKGVKSWVAVYRFNGAQKRITYGNYPNMSLSQANLAHAEAMQELEQGIDPSEEKKLTRITNLEALTINELIDEYLEKWAKPRKRSWKEDERILKGEVAKAWGNAKAKQIKRRDVVVFLDQIQSRAPIMANRTLAVVRRMFNFAIERDILEFSPCTQVKMPSAETQKERVLTEQEIKMVWHALDQGDMHLVTKLVLRMELITAQRKGEVISMRWDEVNFDKGVWEIPAEKSKNKKSHRVPLSKLAKGILQQSREQLHHPVWVFPSSASKDVHVSEMAINKAVYRGFETVDASNKKNPKIPLFDGVGKFTPHDLRRTAASHMTALGIPRLVVSKILNHVESSVTAIYDRHSYDKEKSHALELWSEKIEAIIR